MDRRITELGIDMRSQLKNELNSTEIFAIQVDGSTDVSTVEQLLAFIRFIGKEDIERDWKKCVAISSDGASSMTGINVGFVKYFKVVAPNSSWYHCIIHKYALAAKSMPALLKEVMDDSVKIVNLIKSSSLNSRLFAVLSEELGAEFSQLLYHTDVRWLSRGKVLNRVFCLKDEIYIFLSDSKHELAHKFDDKLFSDIYILLMSICKVHTQT
ncbi:protein FAM200A-like [Belonocnema kinseyi]|uniref:protein FAM200A-like n=1 Tax=Belonocnema kinseyi TaxID=2817044 RepID=UPI00143DB247|nr:protein FAM200A-like [Belonocnema kinseyi]